MKFILTKELGKLARWLRILGFDASYYDSDNLSTLIIEALRDDRIIVTRRRRKIDGLERITVSLSSPELKLQLKELIGKLRLPIETDKLFSRCVLCNKLLAPAKKDEVKTKVPEYVFKVKSHFMRCLECGRIYWQGTHWGNINRVVEELIH